MRAYEMMVIFEPELEDSDVKAQLKQVDDLIQAAGGTVHKTDMWGKRRFAYEINHKFEGIYVVLELTTDGGDLNPLDRFLRLADEVVRHKLLRLPDREAARRGLYGAEAAAAAGVTPDAAPEATDDAAPEATDDATPEVAPDEAAPEADADEAVPADAG